MHITKIATFAMTFFISAAAFGHAFLDHAEPKVGAEVDGSPRKAVLTFTQKVEPAFSTLKVSNAEGKQVDLKDVAVDPEDASILSVSLPVLPPGDYRVEWRVTSVDTHKTHGSFTFTVKQKG